MKKQLMLILLLVAPLSSALAQQPATAKATETAAPKKQAPPDADQLAIVRLRAQLADAQVRMEQGRKVYEAGQKQVADLEPRLNDALEAIKGHLPKPTAGKVWVAQDDGQMGVIYVEADAPKAEAVKPKE